MFSPACDTPLIGESGVCAGTAVLEVKGGFVVLADAAAGLPGVALAPDGCCGAVPAIASVQTAAAAIVPARMAHAFRGELTHRRIPNLRVLLLPSRDKGAKRKARLTEPGGEVQKGKSYF